MNEEYYFISDLHIGGDAELDICDFELELIEFLKELEKKDENTELIIVGDVFGFWELTGAEGIEKLEIIAGNHRELFDQFRKTGEKITITVLPGNHDYILACEPDFIEALSR
ncbi:MAG: metallophosphoesterase, partial [Candidatus Auribacterota bacterium]|nr:metallophosphoesterase [Candidatus Auribacterota bacterium]